MCIKCKWVTLKNGERKRKLNKKLQVKMKNGCNTPEEPKILYGDSVLIYVTPFFMHYFF